MQFSKNNANVLFVLTILCTLYFGLRGLFSFVPSRYDMLAHIQYIEYIREFHHFPSPENHLVIYSKSYYLANLPHILCCVYELILGIDSIYVLKFIIPSMLVIVTIVLMYTLLKSLERDILPPYNQYNRYVKVLVFLTFIAFMFSLPAIYDTTGTRLALLYIALFYLTTLKYIIKYSYYADRRYIVLILIFTLVLTIVHAVTSLFILFFYITLLMLIVFVRKKYIFSSNVEVVHSFNKTIILLLLIYTTLFLITAIFSVKAMVYLDPLQSFVIRFKEFLFDKEMPEAIIRYKTFYKLGLYDKIIILINLIGRDIYVIILNLISSVVVFFSIREGIKRSLFRYKVLDRLLLVNLFCIAMQIVSLLPYLLLMISSNIKSRFIDYLFVTTPLMTYFAIGLLHKIAKLKLRNLLALLVIIGFFLSPPIQLKLQTFVPKIHSNYVMVINDNTHESMILARKMLYSNIVENNVLVYSMFPFIDHYALIFNRDIIKNNDCSLLYIRELTQDNIPETIRFLEKTRYESSIIIVIDDPSPKDIHIMKIYKDMTQFCEIFSSKIFASIYTSVFYKGN